MVLVVVVVSPFVLLVVMIEDDLPCPVDELPADELVTTVVDMDEDRLSSRFCRVDSVFCCLFSLFVVMGTLWVGPVVFVAMLTRGLVAMSFFTTTATCLVGRPTMVVDKRVL